jgi:hypothetical protein
MIPNSWRIKVIRNLMQLQKEKRKKDKYNTQIVFSKYI